MGTRVRRRRGEAEVFWREQVGLWRESGETISGFCRERGLTESAFHFWKRQLGVARKKTARGRPTVDRSQPKLLPVSLAGSTSAPLVLEINGATLRISPGVDAALLRTVLASLEAR